MSMSHDDSSSSGFIEMKPLSSNIKMSLFTKLWLDSFVYSIVSITTFMLVKSDFGIHTMQIQVNDLLEIFSRSENGQNFLKRCQNVFLLATWAHRLFQVFSKKFLSKILVGYMVKKIFSGNYLTIFFRPKLNFEKNRLKKIRLKKF